MTRHIHVLMDLLWNAVDLRKWWILAKWPSEKWQGTAETSSSCSHQQHLLAASRHRNSSSNYTGGKPRKTTLHWQCSPWVLGKKSQMTDDPKWPKGYPTAHGVVFSNKSSGKEDKGGFFAVTAFAFPRKHFAHLQEGAKHLPADGKELLVSLLAHRALLHSNWSFLTFALPALSPIPLEGGSRQRAIGQWVLSCWPGSIYHTFPLCNIYNCTSVNDINLLDFLL